jgi:hypothetical protein
MPREKKEATSPVTRKKAATKAVPPPPQELTPNADPASTNFDLTELIRERAYQLYEQRRLYSRNGDDGSPEQDWYEAEQEILRQWSKSA